MEPPNPPLEPTTNRDFNYALACARMRTDAHACLYDTDTETVTETEQRRCKKREKNKNLLTSPQN